MTIEVLFEVLRRKEPILWAMAMSEIDQNNTPVPDRRAVCLWIVERME